MVLHMSLVKMDQSSHFSVKTEVRCLCYNSIIENHEFLDLYEISEHVQSNILYFIFQ